MWAVKADRVNITNKKAKFDYEFIDTYEAGIQLTGSEIKSIREGRASFTDAFCHFMRNELWVKGIHISGYKFATYNGHEETRERKLLLKKRELNKLRKGVEEKGYTIIPYKIYINQRGWAKLQIALARGKKQFDKRETIKKRDIQREIDRGMY